jgi:hypothetical protein
MAENKLYPGVTARISDSLADQLEEVIRQRPRGERPTRGELLDEAWKKAHLGNPVEAGLFSDSVEIIGNITDDNKAWLLRLSRILARGDAATISTAKAIIERFEYFTRIHHEEDLAITGVGLSDQDHRRIMEKARGIRARPKRNQERNVDAGTVRPS